MILSSALALAACGGGGGHEAGEATSGASGSSTQSLVYSYPANGQHEVAAPSPVVLRFASAINLASAQSGITLHEGGASGTAVATTASLALDSKGVILTPTDPLQAHQQYTVVVHNLGTISNKTLSFKTRALQKGPKSLVVEDSDFGVARHFPDGTTDEPVMDFSTFRLQFTQPIDPSTARYGQNTGSGTSGAANNVALVDQNGDLVDATLIVDGPYMTIDPKPDYLNPGEKYTLTLGTGLASTFGETLSQADDIKFTPKDSTPNGQKPAVLVQRITDSQNGSVLSPLSGQPVNEVAVKGTLLGENGVNSTQASAVVHAELADPVTYTNVLPIRIPKGTILTGSSIDVKIGGAVDAGYESGKVTMTLLSDATGTMVLNPYSTQSDAPRIVHLFMDVGITTEDPRANGGFTQNLLHIELVGTSKVDTKAGVLDLDAISVVQPNVLGQEYGYAVLSFQLQSYRDQTTAPQPVADNTPPEVQSWTFGTDQQTGLDKTAMLQPTDPLIINFDKPLDPQSVLGHVHLYKVTNGTQAELEAKVRVDGAAIVIEPKDPLQHPEETGQPFSYEVALDAGITDVSGNPWTGAFDKTFELGTLVEEYDLYKYQGFGASAGIKPTGQIEPVRGRSPYVLGLYPGYPCAMNTATRDLASGKAGRCIGGMQPNTATDDMPGQDDLGSVDPLPADDILPVPDMPANRPIVVVFSKLIDRNSLFDDQGNTPAFQVYKVNAANPDDHSALVSGTVTLAGDTLRFIPDQPWQNGQLYGYTLQSNGDATSSIAQCDANQSNPGLCGPQGLPLKTQLLEVVSTHDDTQFLPDVAEHIPVFRKQFVWSEEAPLPTGGGPALTQYFKGAPLTGNVLQLLRLPQAVDLNKNLWNDSTAQKFDQTSAVGGVTTTTTKYLSYQANETGQVDWQPDSSTAGLTDPISGLPLDPDGVKPPPNSAKVLSAFYGYRDMAPILNDSDILPSYLALGAGAGLGATAATSTANVGCGWSETHPFPDQADCDVYGSGFFAKSCSYAVPMVCPHDKFTYLHGVLFADVTNQITPDGDVKVKIYPGHIVTTSFRLFLKSYTGVGGEIADSGYQVMRMRYPASDQYIPGWITNKAYRGRTPPVLYTNLDLYLDAPLLTYDMVTRKNMVSEVDHNQHSYPVSMSLSGSLDFLSDGRMVVEQYNDTPVKVDVRANNPITHVDLLIPKRESFLRYVSQPIK